MQLATAVDNQPWACNVHYYADAAFNLCWVSTLKSKHSQDIAKNPKVAAAIMVHENTAAEPYVIGISIEGTAELIDQNVTKEIAEGYAAKHSEDDDMPAIVAGKHPFKFYRLEPSRIILFDNKNFPKDPRKELNI